MVRSIIYPSRRSESEDRRCLATRPLSSDFSSRTSDNCEETEQEYRYGIQDGCALCDLYELFSLFLNRFSILNDELNHSYRITASVSIPVGMGIGC